MECSECGELLYDYEEDLYYCEVCGVDYVLRVFLGGADYEGNLYRCGSNDCEGILESINVPDSEEGELRVCDQCGKEYFFEYRLEEVDDG